MSSADRIAYFRLVSAICFTCTKHWNKSISSEANLKQRARCVSSRVAGVLLAVVV